MNFYSIVVILAFLSVSTGLPQVEKFPPMEDVGNFEEKTITAEEKKPEPSTRTSTSLREQLKPYFPGEPEVHTSTPEGDEGEVTRSARESSPMIFGRAPHSTKVCIYVTADPQGTVVCGPQVDDKKEVPVLPAAIPAARFASPYNYYQRTPPAQGPAYPFGPSRYAPGYPPSPASRPYPKRRNEDGEEPLSPSQEYNPASAAAASGPTQNPQQLPVAPSPQRLIPSAPVDSHAVYVHSQNYLNPQRLYPGGLQMHSPLAALMRLNCAVDPVGGYLPASAPMPALRFYPVGEHFMTLQDGSPAKFGANLVDPPSLRTQNPFALPMGRRQFEDSAAPSPYADPNSSDSYLGSPYPSPYPYPYPYPYPMDMYADVMQGRSAGEDQQHPQNPYNSYADEVARSNFYLQEDALRQTNEKIEMMQEHLKNLEELASSKNTSSTAESSPLNSSTATQTNSPQAIKDASKPAKRHTKAKAS